jgi:uncharacterized protein with HEPN domain
MNRRSDDGLVLDAIRMRIIEIGEAVKAIEPELLAREPNISWIDIAGIRNHLAYRYFDTTQGIVESAVTYNLPLLTEAAQRLLNYLESKLPLQDSLPNKKS